MPYLHFVISPSPTAAEAESIAAGLLRHTRDILGKRPDVTSIRLGGAATDHWFVGAEPVAATHRTTFFLEIKVTQGTNSDDEKSRYIAAVFNEIEALRGDVDPASYVVVHDVDSAAWGYGGVTQQQRLARRQSA